MNSSASNLKDKTIDTLKLKQEISNTCDQKTTIDIHQCISNKFRSFDGTCNNFQNPYYGSIGDEFLRIIPPKYADGVSIPRKSSDTNLPLPHPKSLIDLLKKTNVPIKENNDLSSMFALWGDLISKDIAQVSETKEVEDCCGENKNNITYCYPLQYVECKNYKRTKPIKCNLGM